MKRKLSNFVGYLTFATFVTCLGGVATAVQAPNPRSGTGTSSVQRGEDIKSNISRRSRGATRQSIQGVVTSRSTARQTVVGNRPDNFVARTASVRSTPVSARSANIQSGTVSRAASARATAIYDDVSKIGGGYATCREAYNTCMDQFCAKSSDTYRRCYCSEKIVEFRDSESALAQAKTLLLQFQDNNLNAVDKTAAEVNAMYSATVGEAAIKNDTSAAASVLSEIGDLLSGNKKATKTSTKLTMTSLDFNSDLGDIWGNNSGSSVFGSGSGQDLSTLEGTELYSAADKQCLQLIKDSCENNAVTTMAKSAYGILVTQDCNAYQKSIDTQKQAVTKTVQEAEKILRQARLEEYRSKNSADVNACITNVKTSILGDMACGSGYKKCLDYTGSYINVNTGDPIYSAQLFKLGDLLNLNITNGDIVSANPKFSKFLDDKKIFAQKALDTCSDKSTVVWNEFKRTAMIEIAQAQDAKIEEVKNSCVSTMKECYDTQSGALASFDNTTAQISGALNAYAARSMCAEKVTACAALYSGPNDVKCEFDTDGKLKNTQCGLSALLNFVGTVDNVKIAEGCDTALIAYAKEICTPASGEQEYPYGCRIRTKDEIKDLLNTRANTYCTDPETGIADQKLVGETINSLTSDIAEKIDSQLSLMCENLNGFWQDSSAGTPIKAFYNSVYGGNENFAWGRCVQNDVLVRCTASSADNTYDSARDECTFVDSWYSTQCSFLGNGYYENGTCYVVQ